MNFTNNFGKSYIDSSFLHHDLYYKLFIYFANYIPIQLFLRISSEKGIGLVAEDIVFDKDIQKSDTETETYDSIEALNYTQQFEDGGMKISDDLKEQEMNDHRRQSYFKRSRHNKNLLFYNRSRLIRTS